MHVQDSNIITEVGNTLTLTYYVAVNSTGYSNDLGTISHIWVLFTSSSNSSTRNITLFDVSDQYNLTANDNGYNLTISQASPQVDGDYTLFVGMCKNPCYIMFSQVCVYTISQLQMMVLRVLGTYTFM